jgi:hypothetical protein
MELLCEFFGFENFDIIFDQTVHRIIIVKSCSQNIFQSEMNFKNVEDFFFLKNVWVEKEGCSWLTSVIKWPLNVIPTFCPFNTYFFHVCLSVFLYVLRIYFTSVCPFSCRYYVFLSRLFVRFLACTTYFFYACLSIFLQVLRISFMSVCPFDSIYFFFKLFLVCSSFSIFFLLSNFHFFKY